MDGLAVGGAQVRLVPGSLEGLAKGWRAHVGALAADSALNLDV